MPSEPRSYCCLAPRKEVSGHEGTGYFICKSCGKEFISEENSVFLPQDGKASVVFAGTRTQNLLTSEGISNAVWHTEWWWDFVDTENPYDHRINVGDMPEIVSESERRGYERAKKSAEELVQDAKEEYMNGFDATTSPERLFEKVASQINSLSPSAKSGEGE